MRTRFLAAALAGCAVLGVVPAARAQGPAVPFPPPVAPNAVLASGGGTLSASNPLNPRGASYFANVHTITLTAGNTYTIRMRASTVGPDSYLYLLSPTGALVASDDDGDFNIQIWSSKMTYAATTSGTYSIIATSFSGGQSFGYGWEVQGPAGTGGTPVGIPNVRLAPPAAPSLGAECETALAQAPRRASTTNVTDTGLRL
jgi:hypothetical protein